MSNPPFEIKGRRECRASNAPAALRAENWKHASEVTTGHTETIRHSPRDGFTAYSTLSPVIGLSCHRHWRNFSANLMPASRHQDHMALPYAACAFVLSAVSVHRIPLPTSVTIAKRPLDLERDNANRKCDLGEARSGIFLSARLDRANQLEAQGQIRFLAHATFKASAADVRATDRFVPDFRFVANAMQLPRSGEMTRWATSRPRSADWE